MKNRTDSWSPDDDHLLANTIIESVSFGKTQGYGFERAGELLKRSTAACGFRWNKEVRKRYEESLAKAKLVGRDIKHGVAKDSIREHSEEVLDHTNPDPFNILSDLLQRLKEELQQYKEENQALKLKLEEKPRGEDLGTLMQLFDRARELGLIENKQNSAM